MRVLIGHERFGVIRDAFRAAGHEAWSCDLVEVAGEQRFPEFHLVGDWRKFVARAPDGGSWDLAIFQPDCTFLTNSAAWAFTDGPYHQRVKPKTLVGQARRDARDRAIAEFRLLLAVDIDRICVENPPGSASTAIRPPDQIVQPHWFGDDASKKTGFHLKNLPLLLPTKHVEPRYVATDENGRYIPGEDGRGRKRWANQTDSGQNKLSPSEGRAMERAKTYPGIAAAMVDQWGSLPTFRTLL